MSDARWQEIAELIVAACAVTPRAEAIETVKSILTKLTEELVDMADREAGVVIDGMADLGVLLKKTARTERSVLPVIAALVALEDEVRASSSPHMLALYRIAAAREGRSGDAAQTG